MVKVDKSTAPPLDADEARGAGAERVTAERAAGAERRVCGCGVGVGSGASVGSGVGSTGAAFVGVGTGFLAGAAVRF